MIPKRDIVLKFEDVQKPIRFHVSLEHFILHELRLRRRDCRNVIDELILLGIENPTKLMQAWKSSALNQQWLLEKGKVDEEDIVDIIDSFRLAVTSFDFRSELVKIFGGMGWMREGEQLVRYRYKV